MGDILFDYPDLRYNIADFLVIFFKLSQGEINYQGPVAFLPLDSGHIYKCLRNVQARADFTTLLMPRGTFY
jgi:hypothetical protein